ncbi:MAG: hypothetical protein KF893_05370 [Caldilineaceae bacterium]|nr:hypothetical protein [Caldilineaceae bacterium]
MTENTMQEILKELSKPFHPSHITWKPGVLNRDKNKALALAYADLRAYQNRLDEVCGMNWSVSYTPWGDRIVCHLTINGVTRSSTGEPDSQSEKSEIAGTAAEAQAFKRACAMFGLGRYLYNLPTVWCEFDSERKQFTAQGKGRLSGIIVQHYRRHMDADVELEELHINGYGEKEIGVNGSASRPLRSDGNGLHEVYNAPTPQTSALTALLAEFNQLGQEIYGDQWEQVCRHNVERISGGSIQSSEELGEDALKKLVGGLKKLKRQRQAA